MWTLALRPDIKFIYTKKSHPSWQSQQCSKVNFNRILNKACLPRGLNILVYLPVSVRPQRIRVVFHVTLHNRNVHFLLTYFLPYLWNQLPSSFRQPHSVHCNPGSPLSAHITSSQSPNFALSLLRPFTTDLKLISFTNPFLHSHSYSFRTAFTDLEPVLIKGALALFVLVSFSFFFLLD